ncbi:hypothetical protein BC833DRAFT_623298 [Globomyces pollinis-pini]|nr:hypothetical protein BC833DRAFT_623298 [Globomyces pollinis-pini]
MGGLTEFGTFTFWAWNLQGVYYLFTLYLHVLPDPSPLLIQTTVILFEVSFSVAILVTVVVTFVLIPVGIHMKEDVEGLFAPLALIMHNLNVIFMVLELIWNQIKFDLSHLPFVILFGLVYVIAAWFIAYSQGYFFYFFLNFNQPKCILLHLALVLALSLFYLISYFTTIWLNPEDNLLAIPVLLFGTWFICCIQSPEVKDLSTKSE